MLVRPSVDVIFTILALALVLVLALAFRSAGT
jgi:hypothetical protein